MDPAAPDYDPRYLAGILFFNDKAFFEAHEVWEGLWMECSGPERRFYQALIQAAVALYHFGNGNVRGAVKLYHSSRNYMAAFGPSYLGLDCAAFWTQMEKCFADILGPAQPDRRPQRPEELIPQIHLTPPPAAWPNPADYESPDDE
jgi:predicted metal-dependent hydrolase